MSKTGEGADIAGIKRSNVNFKFFQALGELKKNAGIILHSFFYYLKT